LSTQVLNTYVSDFHGTTVTIFQKVTPDAATNKAVCYDCHGVHDIRRVDDPEKGLQVRENLLARCQVCHPDATIEFSDSWLSHYIPSPENNPLVYYVNLFYKFFIPGVLGGMAVLVLLDASWQVRRRIGEPAPPRKDDDEVEGEQPATEPPPAAREPDVRQTQLDSDDTDEESNLEPGSDAAIDEKVDEEPGEDTNGYE